MGLQQITGNEIAAGSIAASDLASSLAITGDVTISGLTVGKGGGAVATNTAIGYTALQANTTASNNTAVGYQAGYANTTANSNTAVGYRTLHSNTTGTLNTAIGGGSLFSNTTANGNTAVGESSMAFNTTGAGNSALGQGALYANTTGANNVAIGHLTLFANTTASNNTAVGYQAGYTLTSGATNNTFVGYRAGYSTITSGSNQFFGYSAGSEVTTGYYNTIIGGYNGNQGSLDIRTANNFIVLSDGQGNPRVYWNASGVQKTTASQTDGYAIEVRNSTATRPYCAAFIFTASAPNNTTETFLDCEDNVNQKVKIYSSGAFASRPNSYGGISDIKLKQDIVDASSQWNDIKAIKVRKFRFKDEPNAPLQIGVVAQELEQTSAGLVYESLDFENDENGNKVATGEVTKSVKYSILYMKAIKALQEAMERIETLEAKVTALENK